jgi:TonB family protein
VLDPLFELEQVIRIRCGLKKNPDCLQDCLGVNPNNNSRPMRNTSTLLWLSCLQTVSSLATEAEEPQIAKIAAATTPPRMLPKKDQPTFPYPGFPDREALVYVRFNLSAEGKPEDVEIDDGGFHEERFSAAAKRLAPKLRFAPATLNGQPVPAYGLRIPFRFSIEIERQGVTPEFRREVNTVSKLIKDKNFAGAHFHAQWMMSEKVQYSYEYGLLQATLAQTHALMGNTHRALAASRDATARTRMALDDYVPGGPLPHLAPDDFFFPKELIGGVLRLRFQLAASQGFYLDALKSHAYLQALNLVPADDPSMKAFDKILQHVSTSPMLVANARIDEEETWRHGLFYKTFGIAAVTNGTIKDIAMNCAGYRRILSFKPDVVWTIPGKWNGCVATFKGTPGTEFRIVEYRDKADATSRNNIGAP